MLAAAVQMVDSGDAVNASVILLDSVQADISATTTITVELRSSPWVAGDCNVSIYRLPAGEVATTFRFVWLRRDQPRVSDFSPKSEFAYGGTALYIAVDFPPLALTCANVTCVIGPANPIASCVSVVYSMTVGTAAAPRSATVTFILPAAVSTGPVRPTLYIGAANLSLDKQLELLFPADFIFRAPPRPAVTRTAPSSAAASAAGTAVAATVSGFPPVSAAADIVASFEWYSSSTSVVTVAAALVRQLDWIDGTSGAAVQTIRLTLFTPTLPAAASAGATAGLRVAHAKFPAISATAPFLFVDTAQPQVRRFTLHT